MTSLFDGITAAYNKVADWVEGIDWLSKNPNVLLNVDDTKKEEILVKDCDPMSWVVALALVGASKMGHPKFTKIPGGVFPTFRDDNTHYIPSAAKEMLRGLGRHVYTNDGQHDFVEYSQFITQVNKTFPLQQNPLMQKIWEHAREGLHTALVTTYKDNEQLKSMSANIKIILDNNKTSKKVKHVDFNIPASKSTQESGDYKAVALSSPSISNRPKEMNQSSSLENVGKDAFNDVDQKSSNASFEIFSATERATRKVWGETLVKVDEYLKGLFNNIGAERFANRVLLIQLMKNRAAAFIAKKATYSGEVLDSIVDADSPR